MHVEGEANDKNCSIGESEVGEEDHTMGCQVVWSMNPPQMPET